MDMKAPRACHSERSEESASYVLSQKQIPRRYALGMTGRLDDFRESDLSTGEHREARAAGDVLWPAASEAVEKTVSSRKRGTKAQKLALSRVKGPAARTSLFAMQPWRLCASA